MPEPEQQPPSEDEPVPKSYGNMSEHHWSRTRDERNSESIEYYRERGRAPGVAEWEGARAHYCMNCNGVIALDYDRRKPAEGDERCPHCGVELDKRVRAMFNWVETDQVPESDLKALWPLLLSAAVVLVGLGWLLLRWLLN